jgi:hypothetical protein
MRTRRNQSVPNPARLLKDDRIIAAVQRWVKSFVVDMNLCPFAKRELSSNRVRFASTAAKTEEELLLALQTELELLDSDTCRISMNIISFWTMPMHYCDRRGSRVFIKSPAFIQIIGLQAPGQMTRRIIQIDHRIPCCI